MKLSELFSACLAAKYIHIDGGADYALVKKGRTLYIFFEDSDGKEDWRRNLDFPAKAYQAEGTVCFWAHRGFLCAWESLLPHLQKSILNPAVTRIIVAGYSHGGALAALCHEYIWRMRGDLRDRLEGYGFGAPRVLWGRISKDLRKRWDRFTVIRNQNDIVTHLPPAAFGFSHVGGMLVIGEKGKYSSIGAHYAENILAELKQQGDGAFGRKRK